MAGLVIDIVGPPGCGKTTLMNALIKSQSNSGNFNLISSDLVLMEPRNSLAKMILEIDLIRKPIHNHPIPKKLFYRFTFDPKGATEFDPVWHSFINYCFELMKKDQRPAKQKLIPFSWWLNTVKRRIAIEQNFAKKSVILMDEPLSYRLSMFNNQSHMKDIEDYLELMPLPDAIIHLEGDVSIIAERVQLRVKDGGKIALRHRGKKPNQLAEDITWGNKVALHVAEICENLGVPVLRLNCADSIESNLEISQQFLDELYSKKR